MTEATQVSQQAGTCSDAGIHADVQEAGWKNVVEAVHAKGGRIALRLLRLRHVHRAKTLSQHGTAYLHIAEPGQAAGVELSDTFRYRMSYSSGTMAHPWNGWSKALPG